LKSPIPNPQSLPPGSTIGILGGGQLGRMLAMAAARLGYHAHIFTPEQDSPAAEVARACTVADYSDAAALARFAQSVDVITLEFENVPVAALAAIKNVPVRPGGGVLSVCQHRVREKEFVQAQGIATAPFAAVGSMQELQAAMKKIGLPAILKTAQFGYDGKGQWKIEREANAPPLHAGQEYILEGMVDFTMEISVIAARGIGGEIACFPAVQNVHRNHILHQTIVPAPITPALAKEAEHIARVLAEALQVEGLLAVEMFLAKDGRILVNEMAPRAHNSGHWTLDGCATSQFEQQIRTICGLPLGQPDMLFPCTMTNLIGDEVNAWETHLRNPRARLHLYGKKEARPGRKMGHVTVLSGSN